MNSRSHDSSARRTTEPWQPRYGFGTLLLIMLVFSVMGAAGYYGFQVPQGSRGVQLAFILFTLAAPLLLLVVVSLTRGLVLYLSLKRPARRLPARPSGSDADAAAAGAARKKS